VRVVHLGKFYPPAKGGIETHVQALARTQTQHGWQVEVVCVEHRDAVGQDVTFERGAKTASTRQHDGPVSIQRLGRVAHLARLDVCPQLPAVWHRLRRQTPDLLHLHAPNPLMLLALAGLGIPAPLIITHHSDVIRQRWLNLLYRPLERAVYNRAARILATSPLYLAGSPTLQAVAARVVPVPLGIDLTPYLTPAATAPHWRGYPQPLWLAVGRLTYYKGLRTALAALREVPGTLVVVGTGPQAAELRAYAAELGVSGRIVWAGQVPNAELVGAYQAATALWFPSNARSEGFGLVQVEALASGCPVINTQVPASGVAWVSPHEQTGLTVPVDDPAAFAAAARRLWEQPDLRTRLGMAGRTRALAEFDERVMTARTLAVYEQVLSEANHARAASGPR
jgi:rhamnosyl/mannosyltransferase